MDIEVNWKCVPLAINSISCCVQKPLAGSECLLCTAIVACECSTSARVLRIYTDQVSGKPQALNLDLK